MRQVLVPVVVTDAAGHHVTGLQQADFHVFEDGVEQKITAFSVESSGVPQIQPAARDAAAPAAPAAAPAPAPAAPASAPRPRRTYMILHRYAAHFVQRFRNGAGGAGEAFPQEHSEDSQYVVVALGVSPEMVINVTHDPSAVLAVLESKRMQKICVGWPDGRRAAGDGAIPPRSE